MNKNRQSRVEAGEELLKQLESCDGDHTYKVYKLHTKPVKWKYECQDCDNVGVVGRFIQ